MGKYGVSINGKWEDIVFRNKRPIVEGSDGLFYQVWVGEELWGQVYDLKDLGWSALVNTNSEMNLVEGFKTRLAAAFYIVKYRKTLP